MEASVSCYSAVAIADMAATLTQSAAMVTRITTRKISVESSDRGAQAGELALVRKENERMKGLVKTLEDLKVSLESENKVLKENNEEKKRIIAKLVQDHENNEKVIENLRGLVEEEEKEVSELRNQVKGLELAAKRKDEILAKVADETKNVENVFMEIVVRSEEIYQSYKKALATFEAEPLPLPPPAEGPDGVLRLCTW